MKPSSFAPLAVLAGFALAACSSETLLPKPENLAVTDQPPRYSAAEFAYAASGKDVRVDIIGLPFDADPEAVEKVVIEAMQPDNWGYQRAIRIDNQLHRQFRFTTAPEFRVRENYKVRVIFGLKETIEKETLDTLCASAGPENSTKTGGKSDRLQMVFCRGSNVVSAGHSDIGGIESVADPQFAQLVTATTTRLFPAEMFYEFDRSRFRTPTVINIR